MEGGQTEVEQGANGMFAAGCICFHTEQSVVFIRSVATGALQCLGIEAPPVLHLQSSHPSDI